MGYFNKDEFGGQSAYPVVKVSPAVVLRGAFRRETSVVRVVLEYHLAVTLNSIGNGGRNSVELPRTPYLPVTANQSMCLLTCG